MLSVIPAPKKAKELGGVFVLPARLKVKSDFDLPLLEDRVDFCENESDATVVIIKNESIAKEGYTLGVTRERIVILASQKIGVYYALQTVRKIAHVDTGGREVPCCDIEDEPRFPFRGISLDVSRHFYDVNYIKQYINWLFMEKLNVFHWHLTDDVGWRVEIKKYPLLTEIGSKRAYTQLDGWQSTKMEKKPYSGYYTQEQIKEIVAYAKERGITVIPEIDFPAHCAAVFSAYSNLACRDLKRDVPGYFGAKIPTKLYGQKDWNRTLCMGKEESLQFVYDVLDEICEMFDSPYIHLGGDEAPMDEWKKCPNCQRVMKENNLKNEEELQGWFENKVSQFLKTKD
ncbi:beta-N-acetylhexosaminidase, partial [Eubacterium coprostanoligenes]|uniref:beta-N-acetylhexosaminidase n=1 Tax=Eubacterium coprostanoligenes TaxID=290054 RepID=UPI0023575699